MPAAVGRANLEKGQRAQSLLQLIVRPDECDGREVEVGAYVVLDSEHAVGFLEYGVGDLIVDNSAIGFEFNSPRCRSKQKKEGVLVESDILRIFSTRKAAYGFVHASFEKNASRFAGGRICDITDLRLLPASVLDEKD